MKDKVLIDTSIWIEFFRGQNQKAKNKVVALIKSKKATLAGVVLAELFHGVKNEQELELLKETMDALTYFEANKTIWERTGEILRRLRLKGVILPLTDVLLAAIAIENDCEIFTRDTHFREIDKVKLHSI